MIVFFTRATAHFAPLMQVNRGTYTSKQFTDGEWYVFLESDVRNKHIWVITATNPPADHIVELLLLLNVLERNGPASINLLFTYFGYARHDRPLPHEASSAQVISRIFKDFKLAKIIIIHAHSPLLENYLSFENIIPIDLMCRTAQSYKTIAAPDEGAYKLIEYLADYCDLEPIYLSKIRPEQEVVKILEYDGMVRQKRILIIDDIIATGNTIIEVAKMLKKLGADEISVWATHGIFSNGARARIANSDIHKVYVTNTLLQEKSSSKIEVVNIAPFLEQLIKAQ
jgi:ribose-phosphate pyrophosphokinase